jgi:hypothetical protein
MSLQTFSQHVEMDLSGQKSLIIFMCTKLKIVNIENQYLFCKMLFAGIFSLSFSREVETYTALTDVLLLLASLLVWGLSERALQKSICQG